MEEPGKALAFYHWQCLINSEHGTELRYADGAMASLLKLAARHLT